MQRNSTKPGSEADALTSETTLESPNREAFIPLNRRDIIELCLQDQRLSPERSQAFRDFCEILSAYFHFQFHSTLESIKDNYAPFNPNADVQSRSPHTPQHLTKMQDTLVGDFRHLLEKSNYIELSKRTLRQAMEERSLIPLHTDVDFGEFQKLICYYRGDIHEDIEEKGFLGRQKTRSVNIFERVVLMIQFKRESYFKKRGIDPETLNYIPGKIYLYFYKNVPKYDLELLFPNVKTSMTWRDRLMLLIPAIGAGIGVIIKLLPQILIIGGLIYIVFLNGDRSHLPLHIQQGAAELQRGKEGLLTALVTILSLVVALGGFGAKQYSNYKSKKIKFQKHVTDTLFFRSMANHSAVFQLLVDVAEEEECKEVILAYYHLLISDQSLSAEELDRTVETWMHQRLNIDVDFDIQDALDKLHRLQAPIDESRDEMNGNESRDESRDEMDGKTMGLVEADQSQSGAKRYRARSLTQAKHIIDRLWDNAFQY